MGIRFYCPNGHKMNVKTFQAGLKGICPTCGATMQIPLESTRPSSRQERAEARAESPDAAVPVPNTVVDMPSPTTPASAANATPSPISHPATSAAADHASAPATFAAAPSAPASAAADPLAAAGNLVWYVRPPSGGQFGPATGDIMRTWLAEGRVSANTLVWREGWREWQAAGDVFPQLSSGQAILGLESILAEPIATPGHGHPPKPHVPPRSTQLITLGALVITVLALLVLFLAFWLKL
jgi:hypothetical protein